MPRNFLRFVRVACLSVIALALLGGGIAEARKDKDPDRLLDGEYRISIIESCVQTTGEFDEDFRVPSGVFRTRTKGGITTYNGDGTGTTSRLVLNMFESNPFGPFVAVSQSSTECDLTYTVNPDRSFTQTLTNCSGTVLTGPRTGEPFTLSDIELQGQIDRKRQVLSYTNNDTTVVTLTLNPETPEELIFKRICAGIGTGVKGPKSGLSIP